MPHPQTDLLNGLTPRETEEVLALGSRAPAPAGTVLFRLGDPADRVYLLTRGRIALTLPIQVRGEEEDILVEERLAGETVGWSGLVPPYRFTLKATAKSESEVLIFPRDEMLEHFAARPGVGLRVTHNLAGVIGRRLGIFQAMWAREMQRAVEVRFS
ncbi:MAG: Crp/Fnr family transcriptional regulator [Candidatus Eisenbacteria bacterium]|nr:cyclic nucleotide-binding domain-containing protein [Candidatus Eisenbacteria bacterium]